MSQSPPAGTSRCRPLWHPGNSSRSRWPNLTATLDLFVDDLDLAWQSYLTSGGFPRAVAEHHRTGAVSDAFINDLVAWLHREVDPDVPAESVALLLDGLERRSSSPLSRASAASDLGYANRPLFDRRVERLVTNFAALWCPQIDDKGRRVENLVRDDRRPLHRRKGRASRTSAAVPTETARLGHHIRPERLGDLAPRRDHIPCHRVGALLWRHPVHLRRGR